MPGGGYEKENCSHLEMDMLNKKRNSGFVQRGAVTSSLDNAREMLKSHFGGTGYIYWFGSFWAVYTR